MTLAGGGSRETGGTAPDSVASVRSERVHSWGGLAFAGLMRWTFVMRCWKRLTEQ